MRKALAFYTVVCHQTGYPVKYVDPETYRVKTFCGPFDDPGHASQEFRIGCSVVGFNPCYLNEQHFQAKVRALAQLRRNEEKKKSV